MAQTLQSIGGRLDMTVRQGTQSAVIRGTATDSAGAAIDLTGVTPVGVIYDASGNIAGSFTFDNSQLAAGIVRSWIASAVSAALTATPLASAAPYSYAINLDFGAGNIKPFLFGTLKVIAGAGQ